MKKIVSILLVAVLMVAALLSLASCAGENTPTQSGNNGQTQGNGSQNGETPGNDSDGTGENTADNGTTGTTPSENPDGTTPITLTINDEITLNGYLNASAPAKSLIAQLPLTVRLNDSDNDYCGGNIDIEYSDSDVQYGYKDGDLAFWTPANNFVIFVDDEESSSGTSNLVILGRITDDLSVFDRISGTISVTIALKEELPETPDETETPTTSEPTTEPELPTTSEPATEPETPNEPNESGEYQMRITVGDTVLIADMYDNETAAAIREMLPLSLPMMDLYGREMCYRFTDALPASGAATTGYEVGEIVYYPPMHSFVIMYAQNGEHFQMQKLGKITGDVSVFDGIGDVTVSFEIVEK